MRKIFTLLTAAMCSFASFAQDIQLETKDGQVIANGSKVTVKGEMVDMDGFYGQFDSHLYVRNISEGTQAVIAHVKAITGDGQICWGGGCQALMGAGSEATTGAGLIGAQSSESLLIDRLCFEPGYMSMTITRTVEVSIWTSAKPNEKITATVTYTNDEALLKANNVEETAVTGNVLFAKDNVLYGRFNQPGVRQLQVFDVAGKLCKNVRLESESVSLSLEGMAKGLYIYRVMEGGNSTANGKFLVK